jgi:hypothetical protein
MQDIDYLDVGPLLQMLLDLVTPFWIIINNQDSYIQFSTSVMVSGYLIITKVEAIVYTNFWYFQALASTMFR